ncbi:hypothetical protein [Streptomyces dysideae]|uniref:hypothetical protein n=1 Tax=Streptomyces dysideae TaxID=909626 RepID=UPI00099EBD12|nr:hypothetical protein [Streptomyces dysideae]
MFQDSPIYDRLIAERGDIPTQARREAERIRRELEFVMQPLQGMGHAQPPGRPGPPPPAPPTWQQRNALLPGPPPH